MDSKTKILVIDDDREWVEALSLFLTSAGYAVSSALGGREGLRTAYNEHPHLILLDVVMPGMDGFQVLEHLRLATEAPVMMFTTTPQDRNAIRGYQQGAVDFIAKGGNNEVLLAQIKSRLRTHKSDSPAPNSPRELDASLTVNLQKRQLFYQDEPVHLTPTQWRLLHCLMDNEGRVTSFRDLLAAGWGDDDTRDPHTIKVQISLLRQKLHDHPYHSHYIHTIREDGYLFEVRR